MTLIKPPLVKTRPGAPITSEAWTALAKAVAGSYTALGDIGQDYAEVAVTWRGAPVPDARVVGTPIDPVGPSLAALPPAGAGATHTLVGVMRGSWRIVISAPGYATETREVQVQPATSGAPAAKLAVELTLTSVPVPRLVGMPANAASYVLGWTLLHQGVWEPTVGIGGFEPTRAVLLQAPSSGHVGPRSSVDAMYDGNADNPPWTTVVPDFLGWPASTLAAMAELFQLKVAPAVPATAGARVVGQDLAPGSMVAPPTTLNVEYAAADPATTTFATFPGTHTALKDKKVEDAHKQYPVLSPDWAPWPVARSYLDDVAMTIAGNVAASLGIGVAGQTIDEATWRSFTVISHWSRK